MIAVILERARLAARRPSGRRRDWLTLAAAASAALGVLQFYSPTSLVRRPFPAVMSGAAPAAEPSRNAFGKSGEVRVRLTLPGERVDYPLEVQGDPATIAYQWVRLGDTISGQTPRALGAQLIAPDEPGYYQLSLVRGTGRQVLEGLTLAVLVPFERKLGAELNGYRIGTYVAERVGMASKPAPEGFLEVEPAVLGLKLTKHLRLGDFLGQDGQTGWPRYVAVEPRLLDKVELIAGKLAEWRGEEGRVTISVNSGFRAPAYNMTVRRAARDSRHQYGDAADLAIDANGDGVVTAGDTRLVALAVEQVEREHPELVGGLGIYTSRRYRRPYVHIDARGRRARWRG